MKSPISAKFVGSQAKGLHAAEVWDDRTIGGGGGVRERCGRHGRYFVILTGLNSTQLNSKIKLSTSKFHAELEGNLQKSWLRQMSLIVPF